MKKNLAIIIAIIILSVCSITKSNAQFSAGLRLGFNASKYFGSRFIPGLHIGPYFRMAFKEKYRVQIDILFSTKGAVYNESGYYNNLKGSYDPDTKAYYAPFYIDIPLMFNYKPIAGLYFEAGVQPSIALTELSFGEDRYTKFIAFNDSGLKRIIIAPVGGVGYEFKKVSLGMRVVLGGTKAFVYTYDTRKNLTLMATFGFKF
jgi:hypothetical protein